MTKEEQKNKALADLNIFRGQVWPRRYEILVSWSTLVAIVLATATTITVLTLPVRDLPISIAVDLGFTFASISMGACISGLVLSLALPGEARLRGWARIISPSTGRSRLSDVVFTFFWAACCQIALLAVCVLTTAIGGAGLLGAPSPVPPSHYLSLIAAFFVFYYAVSQLYVILQTLVQIGVLIIFESRVDPTASSEQPRL